MAEHPELRWPDGRAIVTEHHPAGVWLWRLDDGAPGRCGFANETKALRDAAKTLATPKFHCCVCGSPGQSWWRDNTTICDRCVGRDAFPPYPSDEDRRGLMRGIRNMLMITAICATTAAVAVWGAPALLSVVVKRAYGAEVIQAQFPYTERWYDERDIDDPERVIKPGSHPIPFDPVTVALESSAAVLVNAEIGLMMTGDCSGGRVNKNYNLAKWGSGFSVLIDGKTVAIRAENWFADEHYHHMLLTHLAQLGPGEHTIELSIWAKPMKGTGTTCKVVYKHAPYTRLEVAVLAGGD